ncbi:AraC family transcriptional regulator [Chitinophaga sp.]|uniref:helix-turn-helix domain-containing protein n=1 Tax=Chitinophaga sp. TaxID=1869181 RepID=UPI0031DE7F21
MKKPESIEDFYINRAINSQPLVFNLLRYDDCLRMDPQPYRRRDFYKVSFMRGRTLLHYGDKSLEVNGDALAIFSPDIPYTVDMPDGPAIGQYFIFKPAYLSEYFRRNIKELPLFAPGAHPVYELDATQAAAVAGLFDRMAQEFDSDYAYKDDLIRNCIIDILHYAMRMEPVAKRYQHTDASVRITSVFNELLDRQFPIENLSQQFELKSPADFAAQMGVHVNSLNRALRTTTGKSTSNLIAERLVTEATILLKHSEWNVAEIGFRLGFEDPAHFSHFFKKHTGQAPSGLRSIPVNA